MYTDRLGLFDIDETKRILVYGGLYQEVFDYINNSKITITQLPKASPELLGGMGVAITLDAHIMIRQDLNEFQAAVTLSHELVHAISSYEYSISSGGSTLPPPKTISSMVSSELNAFESEATFYKSVYLKAVSANDNTSTKVLLKLSDDLLSKDPPSVTAHLDNLFGAEAIMPTGKPNAETPRARASVRQSIEDLYIEGLLQRRLRGLFVPPDIKNDLDRILKEREERADEELERKFMEDRLERLKESQ